MTAEASGMAPACQPSTPQPTQRTPRRVWGFLIVAVTATTVARFPRVRDEVEVRLARGESGEDVADLEQAHLAVAVGTVTALVLAVALHVSVIVGAMALERRTTRAGRANLRDVPLSLSFLVVGGVLLCAQVAALVHPSTAGSAVVLVPIALSVALASTAVARRGARWGIPARAGFAAGVALTLTLVL